MIYSLDSLQSLVNEEIKYTGFPDLPAELYDPVRYLFSLGGKRLRPCFVLLAKNLFSDTVEDALKQSLAIEFFHNFTLVHDDIMDKAPLRRGFATLHEKWNVNTAILAGDVLFVKAYTMLTSTQPAHLKEVLNVFNKVAREVCEGQQLDMNFEQDMTSVSIEQYLRMIEQKTAVLLGASLQIGAILGDAHNDEAAELYHFGRNMGIAFQLQDDILDIYGKPEEVGKRVGGDILSNKKTYPLLKALELANGPKRVELEKWLTTTVTSKEEEKINAVKSIYDAVGVQQITEGMIEEYTHKAFQHLERIRVSSERKEVLSQCCHTLSKRRF